MSGAAAGMPLPEDGIAPDEIRARLDEWSAADVDWRHGRGWSLVYDSPAWHHALVREAAARFVDENALSHTAFPSAAAFEERLRGWLESYNRDHAHPYRWTYTGEPLVRATPFSHTRRQQRHGRAWSGTRPPLWERCLYPPRPYQRRKTEPLATNL